MTSIYWCDPHFSATEQEEEKRKRGSGKISPCLYLRTYFYDDCQDQLDTAVPQEVEKDPDTARPEPLPISNPSNAIRQERNLVQVGEYPIIGKYADKYRFILGREKGSEYLSRYTGLPIYKYTKKYPLGYGRKKRSAE